MLRATVFLSAVIFAAFVTLNGAAAEEAVPAGNKILDITLSPDHRYGVTVPETVPDLYDPTPQNRLVEVKTGRVLTLIQAGTGYERANHNAVLPSRWAKDDFTSVMGGGRQVVRYSPCASQAAAWSRGMAA